MEPARDTGTGDPGGDEPQKNINASLSDTSKAGFNPKAWNDPPSGLLGSKPKETSTTRTKLTTRVAFPLDASKQPGVGTGPLAANAPPPTQGFQPPVLGGVPPPPLAPSVFNPNSSSPPS